MSIFVSLQVPLATLFVSYFILSQTPDLFTQGLNTIESNSRLLQNRTGFGRAGGVAIPLAVIRRENLSLFSH